MGSYINVIGAGLAGSEAAWQIAEKGLKVRLFEMRPQVKTPAHHTDFFAELVCSNSLRSNSLENAVGVLKEEMRNLSSLIIKAADKFMIPAGGALAVDRDEFSKWITKQLTNHKNIEVVYGEVSKIPEGPTVIATGPLTSDKLSESIRDFIGMEYLSFFDAAAPIVSKDSIDMSKVFLKSRYDKGEADYINCPMNILEFNKFHNELIKADTVILKDFELNVFEGCMPFEVMAKRGKKTLLHGPMKPVGLEQNGIRPYAVVQLRQDNAAGDLYNIVGFQTNLKFAEQKRILQMVPGLENVEIIRYGVMHRNTFIISTKVLKNTYQSKLRKDLFFAVQMTGVKRYVESAASGLLAGLNIIKFIQGDEMFSLSSKSVIGSMVNYISNPGVMNFQPMNANYGLMPSIEEKHYKRDRKRLYGERAIESLKDEFNLN